MQELSIRLEKMIQEASEEIEKLDFSDWNIKSAITSLLLKFIE